MDKEFALFFFLMLLMSVHARAKTFSLVTKPVHATSSMRLKNHISVAFKSILIPSPQRPTFATICKNRTNVAIKNSKFGFY